MSKTNICGFCGVEYNINEGSAKYCSKECRYKHHSIKVKEASAKKTPEEYREIYLKALETVKEKYGRDTICDPEKISKTYLSKPQEYWDERESKIKKTRLKKYGNENYRNVEKVKQTKLERYGDENYVNSEKNKQTKLERYGCYFTNSEKANKTKIERYGSLSAVQQRAFDTYKEHTGKSHPSHRNITNYENFNEEFIRENFIKGGEYDVKGFSEYFNIVNAANWFKKHFGANFKKFKSLGEKEFISYVGNCDIQHFIKVGDSNFYVDGFKDGVVYEFLGIYWHGKKRDNPQAVEWYDKTFERFDKILSHPDVKEIRYIWEDDFWRGVREHNIEKYVMIYGEFDESKPA